MRHKGRIKGLYAITDPNLLSDEVIYDKVSEAIDGGISVLQYRNKVANKALQYQQAEQLSQLCAKNQVTFIINDDINLAYDVDADGVHLGKEDSSLKLAREKLGINKIIGISCYNQLNSAEKAQKQGADYIAFGRFFPSKTKPEAVQAQLSIIKQAKRLIKLPIVAIGGINLSNIEDIVTAQADAIAIIHAIFATEAVYSATKLLNQRLKLL